MAILSIVVSLMIMKMTAGYYYVSTSMTWANANAYCQNQHGTTLATVTSDADITEMMGLIASGSTNTLTWIGLNDLDTEGYWVWESGYSCGGNCDTLSWWHSGEPNNSGNEDCALIYSHTGTFNDGNCDASLPFMCDESDPTSEPTANPSAAPTNPSTAVLNLHCDNVGTTYISSDGVTFTNVGTETLWWNMFTVNLPSVTAGTVIRHKCDDVGSVGAFIATVQYDGLNYSTTSPLTDGYWEIINSSDGVTSPLVYNAKTSAPWNLRGSDIASDAYWVWNGNVHNTMWFEFSFAGIIVPTATPSAEPTEVPTAFHCGAHGCDDNLVCDQATGQCMRDCDVLHIDAFLTECSAEWDENNDTLAAMSASIADNADDIVTVTATANTNKADITTVTTTASTNTQGIATVAATASDNADDIVTVTGTAAENAANISSVTAAATSNAADIATLFAVTTGNGDEFIVIHQNMSALEQRIEALESTITKLAVFSAEAQSGNLDVGPSGNTMTDLVGDGLWSGYSLNTQDVVIIGLLVINVILVIALITVCVMGRGGRAGKVKYAPVVVAGDSEMEELQK